MADDVQITVHVRDLTGPGFQSVNRNINELQRNANGSVGSLRGLSTQLGSVSSAATDAAGSLGSAGAGGGLKGSLIGVGAALGTTLLPSLGALAPMLSGIAVVGGGAALAMDDLKEKAKQLKKPFEEWKKVAEKAVAPHTEKAVTSLKGAMRDLTPVIEVGADTFGRITERAAAFADSPAFKSAFAENARMGARWVEEFAGSVGTFTQSFLEFGTKSQPALDAWDNVIGGLLDTGLPGMFRELEQGIGGSSEMVNGLASFLNEGLLETLGRVSGSFAEAFGPLTGELLEGAGNALTVLGHGFEYLMELLEPFAAVATDGLRAFNDVASISLEVGGALASTLGGALMEALLEVAGIDTSNMGSGFRGFSEWVKENEPQIRGAFFSIASGITEMVTVGITMLPQLWGAFRMATEGILFAVDGLVSGLATAFGDLPGIGDVFENMNTKFDNFASDFRGNLDKVGTGIDSFVTEAVPRLNKAQIKLSVHEAEQNLASIKKQLQDPALTRERRAKLTADKKDAEEALATAKRQLADFGKRKATATLDGNAAPFLGVMGRVIAAKIPRKTGAIAGNATGFWGTVNGIAGRVVGTSYINVIGRAIGVMGGAILGRAQGGPIPRLAAGGSPDGGRVVGPGTETSDSIPAMLSAGEYVVRASSVRKYGERFMEAVNSGTLKVAAFAKGGKVSKAEAQARREAWDDLTVSHFGRMAGWKSSEFGNALGNPDSVSSLVNALNQWRSVIMKSTHGGQERALLHALDSAGKKLLGWEKQLAKASASLEKAKDKLDSLKQAASQLAESVKNGIVNSANITKGARGDGPVTVQSIMAGLTGDRDKASAFQKALADLKKRGLSGALLQQIAEAGIEGGGLETASALLKASTKDLLVMNSLQRQIDASATAAGKTTADGVFGKQIAMQQLSVKTLERTTKQLTDSMAKLAASMEKMIEKAIGGKASGGIIGAATGGLRSGWTLVGEHEPELVRLPFGSRVYSGPDTRRMQREAWSSMLNTPRGGARYAATPVPPGPGSDRPVVLNVQIGGREFGQIWVDVGRKEVQTRGGLRATLGGMD